MSKVEPQILTLQAGPDDSGGRIDRWLAQRIAELSRARIKDLIDTGHVTRGRETIRDASFRVKSGDTVTVTVPPAAPAAVAGEAIDLAIVYEDDQVIVVDKPAGLVVHPAAGHASGTLVNALIAHCGDSLSGIGGVKRPGIVHRLDKDTSGLLVIAKTDLAHQSLAEQFKSHGEDGRLRRVYRALVWGRPERVSGVIDAPLTRSSANRTKIAVAKGDGGRRAVTHYKVLETFPGESKPDAVSLLELELETGRTHQIRVHLAHIGHPVLGDDVYGAGFRTRISVLPEAARRALEALGRQALHAAVLGFEHPKRHRPVTFESKIPKDIQSVIDALGTPARSAGKTGKSPSRTSPSRRR